jgi:protein-tyrosine phosphatase
VSPTVGLTSERRALALASIPNLRDVGGHPTVDGSRVRTGLLYRSVALSRASETDLAVLAQLDIGTVFDLRTAMEQEHSPDRLPRDAEHVSLDLLADSGEADPAAVFALMQDPPRASLEMADGATERFYIATYHDMVRLPSAQAAFGRLYRTLAHAGGRASLVHCTTGKDRTGWAVAALLLFLGVRADMVMREYLLSDAAVRAAYASVVDDFVARGGSREVIEPLMSVQPSFLDAALDAMHADHGSVEAYFSHGLGLDRPTRGALRARFLERA